VKIFFILELILLRILLEAAFIIRIKDYLLYDFVFKSDLFKVIESYFLLTIMLFLLISVTNHKKISNILIFVLFIIHYIPSLIIYGQMDLSREFIYLTTLYWFILIIAAKLIKIKKIEFKKSINTSKLFYIIIISWCILVPIICFTYFDIDFNTELFNLFSKEIYNIRETNTEIYDSLGVLNSFLRWGAFVVFPLMFTYFYSNNKKWYCLIPIILQLLLFFTMPFKSWLLIIPLTFILYKVYNPNKFLNNIVKLINIFLVVAILSFKYFSQVFGEYLILLIVRRVFFVPPLLSSLYYDFFSERLPYLMHFSILKYLVSNNYNEPVPSLISQFYYGREFSANTGLFGDAYAIFKFSGVIIFPLILALLFKLLDNFTSNIEQKAIIGVVLAQTLVLTNSSIIAILVGHGFIFMLLMFLIMPKTKEIQFEKT